MFYSFSSFSTSLLFSLPPGWMDVLDPCGEVLLLLVNRLVLPATKHYPRIILRCARLGALEICYILKKTNRCSVRGFLNDLHTIFNYKTASLHVINKKCGYSIIVDSDDVNTIKNLRKINSLNSKI